MRRNHLALLLLLALAACGPRGEITVGPLEEVPPPPIGFFPDYYTADTLSIRTGETFSGLMNRLGMGSQATYDLVQLCGDVFDVRKLRAGNEVQAYYSPDAPRTLEYVVYVQDRIRSVVFRCTEPMAIWQVSPGYHDSL